MPLPESDDQLVLLHNPKCSKSRAALALLEERDVSFEVRPYLDEPLDAEELRGLGARLGRPVSEWVRRKESAFAAAGCSASSPEDALIAAVVANPILLERPILVRGRRAAIGRPPEDILALL